MMNKLWLCFVLFVATLAFCEGINVPQSGSPPQYQIYVVRYATLPDLPVAMFVEGAGPRAQDGCRNGDLAHAW
jgi:hypothetical protein